MDVNKQRLLIEYMISSPDTFSLCTGIIDSSYFDPELRQSVSFIQDYYDSYNSVPDPDQVMAETGITLKEQEITRDKINYCSTEIETFCKRRAIEKAILKSPELISEGDYGKVEQIIRDAITVSLHKDLGLSYFDDPLARLERMRNTDSLTPTGWHDLDEALGGGWRRKDMLLFSANSGGGKSIAMTNLAKNMSGLHKMTTLIVSLELDEDLIAKRMDSMFSGFHGIEVLPRYREVAKVIETQNSGDIYIVRMPVGSKPNDIRAYLKEFELVTQKVPDLMVVDYLDLMSPNETISASDVFTKDKLISEQLRDIGHDYDMFMCSASQQNRAAVDVEDLNHSHIAGGISKINTVDIYISIIMSDQMRAAGEIAFQLLKTRSSDGVGKRINLKWNAKSLLIENHDHSSSTPTILREPTRDILDPSEGGSGLMDLMDVD